MMMNIKSILIILSVSISVPYVIAGGINVNYNPSLQATGIKQNKAGKIVQDIISKRKLNDGAFYPNTQFGLHGMETPFVQFNSEFLPQQDNAYELLSKAGVDSLRSTESAWHRIADQNGNPKNLNDLKYQLSESKKYHLSNLFVVGYPPAKFTVAGNKLSAVKPQYYQQYKDYLYILLNSFKGYDVKYLELGNEVDAPNVWWKDSTPQMYVNEMNILHSFVQHYYPNAKTVAFSATYSRDPKMGGATGGRRFVEKAMQLGIDKYTDAYSLHHFDMSKFDSFPSYMEGMLKSHKIDKPVLDTEQMDTGYSDLTKSKPYDIVKIFTRGFFLYKLDRIDYFTAKDAMLGTRSYPIGLFDSHWNPKSQLLAYAMASDALKGRNLIRIVSPVKNVEAYLLDNKSSPLTNFKYTIVMWVNGNEKVQIKGLSGAAKLESWDLSTENVNFKNDDFLNLDSRPVAIYTNELPDWNNKVVNFKRDGDFSLQSVMP